MASPQSSLPLESFGPHADIPAERQIFAPLIGRWELDVTWYDSGKLRRREIGEWHFSWVLEGRGIQDVWIVPSRPLRQPPNELYEYGSSIRFYDAERGVWQSVWIGPMRGLVRKFTATGHGDGILLESSDGESPDLRWMFTEIAADAFRWSNNERQSDGKFALVQEFQARRTG